MAYRFNDPRDGYSAGGDTYNPKTDVVISRVDETGKLLGAFWYSHYFGVSIRMHVSSFVPNWCTREFLWLAFDYPFNQLGVSKVLGFIRSDNYFVSNFARKLGFVYEAEVKDVFPNGASLIILGMKKQECRWLHYSPKGIKRNE